MDKKPNEIQENLIPMKINNHTYRTVLTIAHNNTQIRSKLYLVTTVQEP